METLQPKLRFPEFEGNWREDIFRNLVKINQGLQIQISERYLTEVEDSHFYITNEFLKEGSDKKYYIKNPTQNVLCDYDDILMTRTGNTGMVVTNVKGAFHNNFFKINYPKILNKGFLYYFLTTVKTQNTIKSLAGTSTIPDLNHTDFYKINFPYPPKEEQTRIANFLSSVDEKLNLLKEKKALLEDYKKGIMQKIFNQEIRFKDDNGNDFGEWEEKSIGNILTIGSGRDYKHLNYGNVPVFGTGGLMTFVDSFLHQGETVCIGRKGTIDKPMYYNGDIWTVDTLFYTHTFIESIPKFVYYVFQSINWKQHNEASGVPSLSKSTIEQILINVPSVAEQTKIANFLSAIDEKIALVSNQIQDTQEYKKGLLQQMFV